MRPIVLVLLIAAAWADGKDDEFDPEKLVEAQPDIGEEVDTWTPCFKDICVRFLPYRPLKSACLTGCRAALNGGMDKRDECEEYCTGVIDHPSVVEWGEKVEDADLREQWFAVCQKGCRDAFHIRQLYEARLQELEEGNNSTMPLPPEAAPQRANLTLGEDGSFRVEDEGEGGDGARGR